jgi:hypothetical protein
MTIGAQMYLVLTVKQYRDWQFGLHHRPMIALQSNLIWPDKRPWGLDRHSLPSGGMTQFVRYAW